MTAYFPHSGYGDIHVQQMYDTLTVVREQAYNQNRDVSLAADFNAETETVNSQDCHKPVGGFGLEPRNSRGQWVKGWASKSNLVITSTFFKSILIKI